VLGVPWMEPAVHRCLVYSDQCSVLQLLCCFSLSHTHSHLDQRSADRTWTCISRIFCFLMPHMAAADEWWHQLSFVWQYAYSQLHTSNSFTVSAPVHIASMSYHSMLRTSRQFMSLHTWGWYTESISVFRKRQLIQPIKYQFTYVQFTTQVKVAIAVSNGIL